MTTVVMTAGLLLARAEEGDSMGQSQRTPSSGSSGESESSSTGSGGEAQGKKAGSSARKSKGKRASVREAEGTEAYDRFEANTVIKSRYQLDGEPLEVDPD